jgi:hypothetical protein
MSVVSGTARRRWAAVVAGAAAIAGAVVAAPHAEGALVGAATTTDAPQALLARALASGDVAFSARGSSRGTLGLPDLPRLGDVAALLGGTTTTRVWWRDSTAWRVDVLSASGEHDTYATSDGVIAWDYEDHDLDQVVGQPGARLPRADDLLPPQAARRLLGGVGSADRLEPLPASVVAGRRALGLRVVPADARSTIGSVDLALDAATGLPLSLTVVDRTGAVALVSELADVSIGVPAASVLTPPDPPGAQRHTTSAPGLASALDQTAPYLLPSSLAGLPVTRSLLPGSASYGTGLVRFSVLPLSRRAAGAVLSNARSAGSAAVQVEGGEAVRIGSGLLHAVAARGDDGEHAYLVAGLVDPALLDQAVRDLLATPPPRRAG